MLQRGDRPADRRKEIYEARHPETKAEAFKGNQHVGGSGHVGHKHDRFTADTAARTWT